MPGVGGVGAACMVAVVPALTAPVPAEEVPLPSSDWTQWQSSSTKCE